MASDYSCHMPGKTQSDLAWPPVSSSSMRAKPSGIMARCRAEMCSLACPPRASSERHRCRAAAYRVLGQGDRAGQAAQTEGFPRPRQGGKVTQALVTDLITVWFWEAKGQEFPHFLAAAAQSLGPNCPNMLLGKSLHSCCENIPTFLPEIFVQGFPEPSWGLQRFFHWDLLSLKQFLWTRG